MRRWRTLPPPVYRSPDAFLERAGLGPSPRDGGRRSQRPDGLAPARARPLRLPLIRAGNAAPLTDVEAR
ncbi:hypothetical protein ACRBEV_17490 [Methylobacterium phyllosphaerae]